MPPTTSMMILFLTFIQDVLPRWRTSIVTLFILILPLWPLILLLRSFVGFGSAYSGNIDSYPLVAYTRCTAFQWHASPTLLEEVAPAVGF